MFNKKLDDTLAKWYSMVEKAVMKLKEIYKKLRNKK